MCERSSRLTADLAYQTTGRLGIFPEYRESPVATAVVTTAAVRVTTIAVRHIKFAAKTFIEQPGSP